MRGNLRQRVGRCQVCMRSDATVGERERYRTSYNERFDANDSFSRRRRGGY